MGRLQMKNVAQRGDRLYFRRKVAGKDVLTRLPALDDPAFASEYARMSKGDTSPPPPAKGSFRALAIEFRASLAKRKLAPATRANYLRYVDRIESELGDRSVKGIRPAHVYIIRDRLEETPGAANNYLAVLRLMLAFACERDWRDTNPAAGVPALALGEHLPWPEDVLIRALEAATPMTRLAIVTGLCSGQRIGDVIRMQWGWCRDGYMQFEQEKTGKPVAIPMHPIWRAELAKHPRKAVTLLYDRSGRPFQSDATLRERIVDLFAGLGVTGYTFHGLRKNAACYLSETGLTDEQIGALTGMSPDMVRHYTRAVRVLRIAEGVADRLAGGTPVPIRGNLSEGSQK
jgi:integrase